MQVARLLLLTLVVALSTLPPSAVAQARQYKRISERSAEPSAWEKFDAGTKKLFADTAAGTKRFFVRTGEGTKKLFTGAKDALTWKKPPAKTTRYVPWSAAGGHAEPKKEKKSWLGSLFRRKEPRPSKTLDDFLGAERLDP